jgi:pyruvate dehydrogenase E2 component (dihydrolipoamide acetyltransferase)
MAIPILLPKVSFVVSEGTINEWLKKTGDSVTKGEPLLVIETEKATVEVEAPGSGFLGSELAPTGTTVPVTTTIGYIVDAGETSPKLEFTSGQLVTPAANQPEQATGNDQGKAGEAQWTKGSPLARRLAKELGVDLAKVKGTGPNGRILQEDIHAFVNAQQGSGSVLPQPEPPASKTASSSQAAVPAPIELLELSNLKRITAERMALSFRTAPHFYLNVEVDMSQAVVMREAFLPKVETQTGVRLSFTDILVFAVGRAMQIHPALNAVFENDKLARYQDVNINLAIDTPRGLTAPIIRHANRLSLFEIAQRRVELVERAQNNRLSPDDIINGTFTISNLGMFGIDVFHAIINPPQAAILAVGQIIKRPIVVNDILELHPTMWLSLSVDHRVADGAEAARFLQDLTKYLENPYQILAQQA